MMMRLLFKVVAAIGFAGIFACSVLLAIGLLDRTALNPALVIFPLVLSVFLTICSYFLAEAYPSSSEKIRSYFMNK